MGAHALNYKTLRWLMYSNFKFNLRKFSIALLSLFMAIMLAFSVACSDGSSSTTDDDDDSSSTTTSTITDYQSIKNGDFEFGTDEKSSYPYSSSINWTRNLYSDVTTAPSSAGTSGIIDTDEEAFNKIKSKIKLSDNPSTPYLYGFVADEYDYNDKDKQSNPQVKGTKILMINNSKNDEGTAQYYKASSSISIPAGEYSLLSFWIKTANLKSMYTDFAGAHVKLSSSNASVSYSDLYFDDVNTNGQWAKFEVAIQGSEISSTTLNLTVGLGKGNGLDHNEYVNGFVFLDNVNVKSIEKTDYNSFVSAGNINHTVNDPNDIEAVSLKSTGYTENVKGTATSFTTYKANLNYNVLSSNVRTDGTGSEEIKFVETANDFNHDYKAGNVIGFGNASNAKGASQNVSSAIGSNDNGFTSFIYMDFVNPSVASYQSKTYKLEAGKFDLVTFYAKVDSKHFNSDKLKVQVLDSDNDPVDLFTAIDTAGSESVRYGDWIKYYAFINNPTDKDTEYAIKLVYGFDGVWEESYALQRGTAVIADLKICSSDKDAYALASANTQTVKQQIYGEYVSFGNASDSTSSDVYGITVDKTQTFTVRETPATNVSGYTFRTASTNKNSVLHGIINSNYYNADHTYGESHGVQFRSQLVNLEELKAGNNNHAQVLVLDNKEATYSRFVSEIKSIAKGASSKIVVKVRAYGNAVANVSLVNSSLVNDNYDVITFKTKDTDEGVKLTSKVTKDSYTKGGWTYVYFNVTAGNEPFEYRIEISNGTATEASEGTIVTEGATILTTETARADFNSTKQDFEGKLTGDGYDFATPIKHTRATSTIKNTDENGNVVETTQSYPETVVYEGNNYLKYVTYETLLADDVIDNTTDSSTTPEEDEHDHEDEGYSLSTNVALQISSIIIALVLIAVIIVIIIRNILKKRAKRLEKQATYYEEDSGFNRNTRERVLQKIAEKKAKQEIELAEDDGVEYDYSEAEQIGDEESIEEVVEEETAEEVVEEETAEEVVEEETAEEPKED